MSGLASCELTPMRQGAWPRLPHNTYTQGGLCWPSVALAMMRIVAADNEARAGTFADWYQRQQPRRRHRHRHRRQVIIVMIMRQVD